LDIARDVEYHVIGQQTACFFDQAGVENKVAAVVDDKLCASGPAKSSVWPLPRLMPVRSITLRPATPVIVREPLTEVNPNVGVRALKTVTALRAAACAAFSVVPCPVRIAPVTCPGVLTEAELPRIKFPLISGPELPFSWRVVLPLYPTLPLVVPGPFICGWPEVDRNRMA